MAIDDEVAIWRLLVLADAGFYKRRMLERGKAQAYIRACPLQAAVIDAPLTVGGIKCCAACVVGNLESTALIARDSVHERLTMVPPHGQLIFIESPIPGRRPEEEDILLCRLNMGSDCLRKQFSHPRTARKYETVGAKLRTIREWKGLERV